VDVDALAFGKLLFGLAAFVFIGLVGPRNRRIAGVLLTFPILNGIALMTDAQPFRVAETIAVMVTLNSALFFLIIAGIDWLPPGAARLGELASLLYRLLAWSVIWLVCAYALTTARDVLPPGWALLLIQLGVVATYVKRVWRPPPPPRAAAAPPRLLEAGVNWGARIILFVLVFCVLLYTARHASDPRWVGMASSLPLPGLFALAYLSTKQRKEDLRPIADTVLFGPVLVIPFNALFAAWMAFLSGRPSGTALAVLSLPLAWGIGLGLLFWLMPRIERKLDR
jgi:hypothetical protein